MAFQSTFRPKIGPFTINTSAKGGLHVSSVSVKVFGVSAKILDFSGRKTGVTSVDLPGPISWRNNKTNQKRR